jgi:hypothetical protein
MQMPKNHKDENAQQTPAVFTPSANAAAEAPAADAFTSSRAKRRLGTGAIIGISAAGLAVIAGSFGAGAAVATVASHNDRGGFSQMGDMAQGGRNQQGQMGQNGPQGQMGQNGSQGQMGPDGQMGQNRRGPQGAPNGTAPSGAPVAPAAPGTATN